MKKVVLVVLLLLIVGLVHAQIAYYDALCLNTKKDSQTGKIILTKDVQQLLRYYYPEKNEDEIDSALINLNPFLKGYFIPQAVHFIGPDYNPLSLSSIGNLNVTNFADGLAKFLVERSKEELNIAFFREFQKFLKDHPEIQVLFPTTNDFIVEINSYQYAAMLPALRSAFQKDLNAFNINLLKFRNITDYVSEEDTNKPIIMAIDSFFNTQEGRAVSGALLIADGIINGNNMADIISSLANDEICLNYPDKNYSNLIQLVELLSGSLRSTDKGRIWITKQQLNDLVKDDNALRIYLGLLYATDQKSKHHIRFNFDGDTTRFNTLLADIYTKEDNDEVKKFQSAFTSTATAFVEVANNTKRVFADEKQADQPSILVYADYTTSIANLYRQSAHLLNSVLKDTSKMSSIIPSVDRLITVVKDASSACYDIKFQNYSALVLHISSILSEVLGDDYNLKFKDDFIKYGIFMANIVEANNSDEVKAAIEAAVLPVGSSLIKRETDFNISLNSYIGSYTGIEYLPKLKKDQWAYTLGLTAPVGIAVSWGKIGKDKVRCDNKATGGKSLTLYIQIVDIGSMASFRMGNDSSEVASEIKLSNIISPGLYLYYGFGRCPLSIGLGGQLGPQLRKVTAEDININKNLYFRFGFNIVIDIPLVNLYIKN